MATILTPDKKSTLGGVNVNEYLLTNHNPNHIDMPTASMAGKVLGITIHNTDWISTASGTTPAEQYTRATVNGNMRTVRVHYYVDNAVAWQNLPLDLSGWHAADGNGNGNRRTIAIECIMSGAYNANDKKSEDNCAKMAAALLKNYNLDINHLYTHTHWLNVKDGRTGSVDALNTMHNSYKNCPAYILPHWAQFKAKVQSYMVATPAPAPAPAKAPTKYRTDWAAGETVNIAANAQLFASADAKTPAKRMTAGKYYIYDGICCKNGRYRITTRKDYCKKTPAGKYVTGYVSIDKMS